jgi:endoglucanase
MNLRRVFLGSVLSISLVQAGFAGNITNNIKGLGPSKNPVEPYFCIQDSNGSVTYALKPGESVDGNKYSGNPTYVGGALRFGGCDQNDTYLGYLGLQVAYTNRISGYSPPPGTHIIYASPQIDGRGVLTGNIQYTPIQPNFNLTAGSGQNADWDFVGINLSGLEFGKSISPSTIPNLSVEDADTKQSDLHDTQAFLQSGMNTVRVPISWGYLQLEGAGKGELNLDYYNSFVKPLLESLTSAHVYAMVDMHSYMRYSEFGLEYSGCGADGKCPDGTLITDANAHQDVWTKLFALIKSDPKINMNYIMFDLVNEPVEVPGDAVFTIQAQVIKALRQQGFAGYILVEGNSWSGLHSWTTDSWSSADGKTKYTNATLFSRENFAKAGITDLSKILINVHQYLDSNYSGNSDQCATDLTTTGPAGYNLNAFVDYLQQNRLKAIVTEFGAGKDRGSCTEALTKLLNYMKDNSAKNKEYGFVGWTIWSTGHSWGEYRLRVTPESYQMRVLKGYLQVQP